MGIVFLTLALAMLLGYYNMQADRWISLKRQSQTSVDDPARATRLQT